MQFYEEVPSLHPAAENFSKIQSNDTLSTDSESSKPEMEMSKDHKGAPLFHDHVNPVQDHRIISKDLFEEKSDKKDPSQNLHLNCCIPKAACDKNAPMLHVLKNGLIRHKKSLVNLLHLKPLETLDKPTVCDAQRNLIPAIRAECQELQSILKDYVMTGHSELDLVNDIENILDQANGWCTSITQLYYGKDFYRKSQGANLHEDLPSYSHKSELDILEYFSRFIMRSQMRKQICFLINTCQNPFKKRWKL